MQCYQFLQRLGMLFIFAMLLIFAILKNDNEGMVLMQGVCTDAMC
jgi:hypothetical protein